MNKCRNNKVTFKPYDQNQVLILDLSSMIPKNHVVRYINSAIDKMNISELLEKYMPGGTSSYNPRMMLKVIIYAYTQKIYSSRKIATALTRDIYFMWLAGMNKPDFRTINSFRSNRMKDIIEQVLAQIVIMLYEAGYIDLKDYFVDGTKIEANANKYTFVWRGSTEKYKAALEIKIKKLMEEIEKINKEEDKKYGDLVLPEDREIKTEDVEEFSNKLNEMLKDSPENKDIQKAQKKVNEDYLPRLKKYNKQLEIMGSNRNSYSKTDNDATFMKMKEDHMKNGQLKPGYNTQIGTQNQFVLNTKILQDRNDNAALVPMLENLKDTIGITPENVGADSGYGNEETYKYLSEKGINNYVKFPYFHKEQKKKYRLNKFLTNNLVYNKSEDVYICPANKKLRFVYESTSKTKTGYISKYRNYECEDCSECKLKENCTKSKGNRKIKINVQLNKYKDIVRKNLTSEKGLKMRKMRPVEVESTFGNIKWNMGFKRFLLRGLEKVKIEWTLLCIAHNFNKVCQKDKKAQNNANVMSAFLEICKVIVNFFHEIEKCLN